MNQMDEAQKFIYVSRYSRWIEPLNRREVDWKETTGRYFKFFKDRLDGAVPKKIWAMSEKLVNEMGVMPSMRAVWGSGPALEKNHIIGYNCFSGDTKFLSSEGYKTLAECVGDAVVVLGRDGNWHTATVQEFGWQEVYSLVLQHGTKSKRTKVLHPTANHRWFINGQVVETADLKVGDRIEQVRAPVPAPDHQYRLGVLHGLVYGDGTSFREGTAHGIRLCGDANELLPYVSPYGKVSYPDSCGGDAYVYFRKGTHPNLKQLPSGVTVSYLLGFIRGWFAADGSVHSNGQASICLSEEEAGWFRDTSATLGWICGEWSPLAPVTNFGPRKKKSGLLRIEQEGIAADDCLLSKHKANLSYNPESFWRVRSIEATGNVEPVYCVVEPRTTSFVLESGIVTGNCCYLPFLDLRAPVELFYILMCGTGVGFSCEHRYIDQMPPVPKQTGAGAGVHIVADSREGWADSLDALFKALWEGRDIQFDYSKIRPRGARLITMGGRASGPEPLKKLHEFAKAVVLRAQGRKLNSEEWLDIGNVIGDVVVVGGVRRSSEINFSDLDDDLIRHAKDGYFPPHRYNSNNAAVYYAKPDAVTFMREWAALAASGRGERGFFNLAAVKNHLPTRRKWTDEFRTNPCGEILLRPFQFCNLTEVVVRADDDFDDLIQKVKVAVWLGAMQSTLTDFPYIRPAFKKNCEEERLMGVSLTGQMDNPKLMTDEKLEILKKYAIKEAKKACEALGINMSVAITTGKPSGTVSQLVNSASGAHPRYSPFYIRRYRISGTDPLFLMLRDQGVSFNPENGQGPDSVEQRRKDMVEKYGHSKAEAKLLVPDWDEKKVDTWVCSFPVKSPKGCLTRHDVSALDQLEWYLKLRKTWCEHNQSITVYVKDEEWMRVGAWVYDHFDELVGVSFLPYDGGEYEQAPYEEITEEHYEKLAAKFSKIDYTQLSRYELEDGTAGAQELACVGGACEIR